MDFSVIDLTNEEQEFLDQVQRFIDVNVTDERLRRDMVHKGIARAVLLSSGYAWRKRAMAGSPRLSAASGI